MQSGSLSHDIPSTVAIITNRCVQTSQPIARLSSTNADTQIRLEIFPLRVMQ